MSDAFSMALFACFLDINTYAELLNDVTLRSYQAEAGAAIYRAAFTGGGNFSVMFPRQSGKNELEAQLEILTWRLIQLIGYNLYSKPLFTRENVKLREL